MSAVSSESPLAAADLSVPSTTPSSSANGLQPGPTDQGAPPASADFGPNEWLVDELYQRYLADPGSVDRACISKITKAIDLVVQYKGHKSWSKFYVSSVGHKAIILGHTWLAEHNPDINWRTGKVKLTRCPDYCGQAKSGSSHPDNDISVPPVGATMETSERIHVMTTIST